MKTFAAAALALVSMGQAQSLFEQIVGNDTVTEVTDASPVSSNVSKNKFGCLVEENIFDHPHVEKTITAPMTPFHADYVQQEAFLKDATHRHKKLRSNGLGAAAPVATCEDRAPDSEPSSFGMFLPVFAAQVSEANPKATYQGRCFDEITFEYEKLNDTAFNVLVTTANPRSDFCKDVILFANTEIQHFELFFFHGTHRLTFQMNSPQAQADTNYGGIKAFAFCENVIQDIESVFNTLKAFVGGISDHPEWPIIGSHVPPYMEKANVEFIKEALGVTLEERPTQVVDIDPDTIQSGDFFGIMRLDGLDPMIMYGTGSRVGHNVMALRFDGELYIVESQDAWYWPTHGL